MAKSWSEDINMYLASKHQAPQLTESVQRFTRKSKILSNREDGPAALDRREFNIVTNTIPNPAKQQEHEVATARSVETHVKRGIAKEMSAANHGYNILSMQPRFGMSEEAMLQMNCSGHSSHAGKRMFKHRDEFNVVTMLPNYQDILDREVAEAEQAKRKMSRRPVRQTNVISHRYLKNHEERAEEEENERRRKLDIVADACCKLNPLTGKFRRLEVEEAANKEKAVQEETQRKVVADHTYKVSRLIGRSEGHAYDIVCNHIYNPEYVLKLEQESSRGVPQRAQLRQAWEQQRDVEEALRDNDAQRAVQRISLERVNESLRRGHELLSNKPFGLSQDEVRAAGVVEDEKVKEATIRPVKPLSVLNEKSVLQRLEESCQPKGWSETNVVRSIGPRTTLERVFNSAPSNTLASVSTFEGRKEHLLPSLEKAHTQKQNSMRQFY